MTLNNIDSSVHASADPERLVPTAEAARILGVRVETLYAYVSRGLLESFGGARSRGRRFRLGDLARLKARSEARAGHTAVAAGALRWGEPVLDSAITAIDARGPIYRGHVAVDLVRRGVTFEAVAELLFTGTLPTSPPSWAARAYPRAGAHGERGTPLALGAAVLAAGLADESRHDAPREAELSRARTLIPWLARSIGAAAPMRAKEDSVAARAAVALGLRPTARVRAAIDAALVLLADHELNASSFAARVAASTGADLYACLAAALGTASGPLHGGAADRIEALLDAIDDPARVASEVEARSRRGEGIPGFGHPLYPAGDPRATPLLERAVAIAPRSREVRIAVALGRRMEKTRGERPTVDLGLVALTAALGAPRGAAASLFVLGRTAGWVAHVIEQREARFLLRPRARYVGPPPLP
ncbi:MAG: citrate synthase family protein [Polyangiaceae bacterium]